jgi:pimeloyl-ACP methyl ester carboxylesterase
MSTHSVNINGIDLVYEKEGSGPTVVFIHGTGASAVYWEAVVPQFMGDYTCFAIEQRGNGRSGRAANGKYTVDQLIEDACVFLDRVTGPAVLVGQSVGGAVAVGAAARRPDLVRAIFSEDSAPHAYTRDPLVDVSLFNAFFGEMRQLAIRRDLESWSVAQFAAEIGRLTVFGPPLADVWPPVTVTFFARNAYGCDPAFYETDAEWSTEKADELCRAIQCPIHIAAANQSRGGIVTMAVIQRMNELGLAFTLTDFPNAGHMISHGQPREFINDLKAFLGRLPA